MLSIGTLKHFLLLLCAISKEIFVSSKRFKEVAAGLYFYILKFCILLHLATSYLSLQMHLAVSSIFN